MYIEAYSPLGMSSEIRFKGNPVVMNDPQRNCQRNERVSSQISIEIPSPTWRQCHNHSKKHKRIPHQGKY